MSLKKLSDEYEVFKSKSAELAKGLRTHFPPILAKIFTKHPWVESLTWQQCEPWNDGDETEFEVLCDKDRISLNDMDSYDDEVYGKEDKQKAFADFADALKEIPTEIMKAMFGESNEVEVKKSGEIFVTEYNDG